jgi:hypothetical protein
MMSETGSVRLNPSQQDPAGRRRPEQNPQPAAAANSRRNQNPTTPAAHHPWPPADTCARPPTWGTSPRSPFFPLPHFPSSSRVHSSLFLPPLSRAPRSVARYVFGCSNRPVITNIRGLRLVAAGTGSELLVYDVADARLVASFQVFDGVRVHGIEPRGGGVACSNYSLAVFGERRVKLFSLVVGVDAEDGRVRGARLELDQWLPGFDQWVLDARFLEVPRWVPH